MDGILPYVVPTIVAATSVVGVIGIWFTHKAKTDDLAKDVLEAKAAADAAKQRADAVGADRAALELRIEREFVRKMDLAEVEGRIGKRLDSVSHDLKNAITNIIPALAGLRASPAKRGSAE